VGPVFPPLLASSQSCFAGVARDVRGPLQLTVAVGGQLAAQFRGYHLVHGGFFLLVGGLGWMKKVWDTSTATARLGRERGRSR
jgi:hypothetical protein